MSVSPRRWVVVFAVAASIGASAADTPDPIAAIRAVEWARGPASGLASAAASKDPRVRQAATVALGRLKRTDALAPLVALSEDPNEGVRFAAAVALGFTPDSAPTLRKLLDAEPASATWVAPYHNGHDRRAALLEGLGRQGDATDVARLIGAVGEPYPTGAAAADALARLARRNVDGTGAAVPALTACLVRIDPRTVDGCAHALRRIDLTTAAAADVDHLAASWSHLPTGQARAWVIRGVWPRLSREQRSAALTAGLADADALVRVAVLDAVGLGDGPFPLIATAVDDRRPDVSTAAIAAVGRLGGANAQVVLSSHADNADPWLEAEAITAQIASGLPADAKLAADPTRPVPVRAAEVESLDDATALIALCADPSPLVRSTAASRLLDLPEPQPGEVGLKLLASDDIVVRQAAVEILTKADAVIGGAPPAFVAPLVTLLRVEPDPDVLASGFTLLASRAQHHPKDFNPGDATLKSGLQRALGHPDAPVREAAEKLRSELGMTIDGVTRAQDFPIPDLVDTARIRSARIITNRGEFRMDLWPDVAPLAVSNFARLADSNFYDGVTFHRVVPGFVAQTGDPRGDGSGGPGYTIPDEVSDRTYGEGAVGMARAGADTGGSQWFVTLSPQPNLDGEYTEFGQVTEGMYVAKSLRRGDRVLDVIIERTAPKP